MKFITEFFFGPSPSVRRAADRAAVLAKIARAWERHPHLSFCQLISTAIGIHSFLSSDDALLVRLETM